MKTCLVLILIVTQIGLSFAESNKNQSVTHPSINSNGTTGDKELDALLENIEKTYVHPQVRPEPVWMFYTGQSFLEIAEKSPADGLDRIYVTGLSDALNERARWQKEYGWIADCTMNKQARQLTEMFRDWLKKNPKRWHEPAPALFLATLLDACK